MVKSDTFLFLIFTTTHSPKLKKKSRPNNRRSRFIKKHLLAGSHKAGPKIIRKTERRKYIQINDKLNVPQVRVIVSQELTMCIPSSEILYKVQTKDFITLESK